MNMILHQLNGREIVINFNNVTGASEVCPDGETYTEIDFVNEDYAEVKEPLKYIENKLGLEGEDGDTE